MKSGYVLKIIRLVVAQIRQLRNYLKICYVKLRSVDVEWSANIHWSVEIERSRGLISLGARTSLDKGVILRAYGGSIQIGADCTVNPYSIIDGCAGVAIANGVRIAPHSVIVSGNHNFSDIDIPIHRQGVSGVGIVIEDDVWIGAGATILDGVIVRKGTVVGAGAVVSRSTEPYSVVVGVPARKKSSRIPVNEPTS